MIEIKSENGKATGKIDGDTNEVLVDLSIIIDAVLDKIQSDVGETKEDVLDNIFNAMKNILYNK